MPIGNAVAPANTGMVSRPYIPGLQTGTTVGNVSPTVNNMSAPGYNPSNGSSMGSGGGSGGFAQNSTFTNDPASAGAQIGNLTTGTGNAIMGDPYTQAALNTLDSATTGASAPFTPQLKQQIMNQEDDQTAGQEAAGASQLQNQISGLGGNINDPSYQAALRQLDTTRQQTNNSNLGALNISSAEDNWAAQQAAAGQLAGVRGNQWGQAANQYDQAANYEGRVTQQGQHQNAYGNPAAALQAQMGAMTPDQATAAPAQDQDQGDGGDDSSDGSDGDQQPLGTSDNPSFISPTPYGTDASGDPSSGWSSLGVNGYGGGGNYGTSGIPTAPSAPSQPTPGLSPTNQAALGVLNQVAPPTQGNQNPSLSLNGNPYNNASQSWWQQLGL